MIQRNYNKTLTALLLTFAYIFLLVHNLVPHHHHDPEAGKVSQVSGNHQHGHGHHHESAHSHEQPDSDESKKPIADPDHLFSNHQHPFADNTTSHPEHHYRVIIAQKEIHSLLISFISFQYSLLDLPDKKPPSRAYLFPQTFFSGPSHALRGPPVS